jgi:hypothetical protein
MWELVGHALEAWRIVLHISAITGMSAGVLAGLAHLAFMLPEWRAIAIRAAIVIGVAYVVGLYTFHLGAADVRAQWDARERARRARAPAARRRGEGRQRGAIRADRCAAAYVACQP